MPSVLFKNKWNVEEDSIKELREKFLAELEESNPELYHPDDIQRVKENDWYVARYVLHQHKNVDNALKMMKESLQWRKEFEANTLSSEDLPKEYMSSRATMIYNKDKNNNPLVITRTKVHVKDEKHRRIQQLYTIYFLEKAVRESEWGIVTVVFDCTDAALSNVDLDMIRFYMNMFKKYYPWGLAHFVIYNLPWYLSGFWKMIKPWIPEQYVSKVKFVDQETLQELVEADQLPIALGGTCTKVYEPKEGVEEIEDDGDDVRTPQAVQC